MRIMTRNAVGAPDDITAMGGLYLLDTGIMATLAKLRNRLDKIISFI